MNLISKICFLVACFVYVFHILFFWLYETTDSWFYWALANFIKTGFYKAPAPYFYEVPSTMEPPLYSLFLFIIQLFPHANHLIHIIQVFALFGAAYFLYKILSRFLPSAFSLCIVSLFLLLPPNIIYAGNLISENFTLCAVSIFIYVCFLILEKKKRNLIFLLIFLSSIFVLLRYNLGTLFLCAVLLGFSDFIRKDRTSIERGKLLTGFVLSCLLLLSWGIVNYKLNGSVGLSNGFGKSLYDRIIAQNRLLPPQENQSLKTLRFLTNDQVNLFIAWWPPEAYIISRGKSSWYSTETQINNLFRDVAIAGLRYNLISYLASIPYYYSQAYTNSPPFPTSVYLVTSSLLNRERCRTLGSIQFCKPIISSSVAYSIWDRIIVASEKYYRTFNQAVFILIILPSLVLSLLSKNAFFRFLGLSYFFINVYSYTYKPSGSPVCISLPEHGSCACVPCRNGTI